jgi:VanZ family protein
MLAFAARGAFTFGILAVTVLSLAPAQTAPSLDLSDKLQHAFAYACLACTGCFGFGHGRPRIQLAVVVALSVFGGLLEVLQPLAAARTGSFADWMANQIGILIGWLLARGAESALPRPPRSA